MNELYLCNSVLPVVCALDSRTAPEPFFHADRVLDFNVLVYVSKGAIYVTEDGTDYTVGEGSLLFLRHGIRHFGKQEIPAGTEWIFVHFYLDEPEAPEFCPDPGDIGVFERLESRVELPKQLFSLAGSGTERSLRELVELGRSQSGDKRFRLNYEFGRLLAEAAASGSREPSLADRIERYLEKTCCGAFSAAGLEREFYLSYKRLAAVFSAEKGMPMQRVHQRYKLSYAAALLRTTALPVGEVAERAGMADPLYFSRCFRREYGISPREYRKRMARRY
ncbi:MAG: helix-turn-helix transcriptional regulator [Ruminococcus sp.]|nr:helix-turn-helix transcriptional regulator [Ruminococcus sp.]